VSRDESSGEHASEEGFDLEAYLGRTGCRGPLSVSEDALMRLHMAQATTIPFENLDIHIHRGSPIRLDLSSIVRKLVRSPRGGYCYEQNGLFRAALMALGFQVTCLGARTLMGVSPPLRVPKTHMALLVELNGRRWLADLGFGAFGLLLPIPLEPDVEHRQHEDTFRIRADQDHGYRLQAKAHGEWQDLYFFTLEPYYPVDFAVMNYFNSTSPESRFTHRKVVALVTPEARYSLVELDFKVRRGDELSVTRLVDEAAYLAVLRERFGIILPKQTSFTWSTP